MGDLTTLTIRLDQGVKDRLDRATKQQRRSKTFIAVEAIQEYLAVQDWQERRIREALATADRGEGISHEAVGKWVGSLGSNNERPLSKGSSNGIFRRLPRPLRELVFIRSNGVGVY